MSPHFSFYHHLLFQSSCALITSASESIQNRHIVVSNSKELKDALASPCPGDRIILLDGVYKGPFITAIKNGSKHNPIYVVARRMADRHLTITGGVDTNEPAFVVRGNYWRLVHLDFEGFVGLQVVGENFSGMSLSVRNSTKGIVLKGVNNRILTSKVEDASQVGILVEGNRAFLRNNKIVNTGTSIQTTETASCGTLLGNVCGGNVVIMGSNFVERNTTKV